MHALSYQHLERKVLGCKTHLRSRCGEMLKKGRKRCYNVWLAYGVACVFAQDRGDSSQAEAQCLWVGQGTDIAAYSVVRHTVDDGKHVELPKHEVHGFELHLVNVQCSVVPARVSIGSA